MLIVGTWIGEYSYHAVEGLDTPLRGSPFTMQLTNPGWFGCFKGFVQDDPIAGVAEEATLRGRVRGNSIRFRKQYPVLRINTPEGSPTFGEWHLAGHGLALDKEVRPKAIRYRGAFDPVGEEIRGTWEIPMYSFVYRAGGRLMVSQIGGLTGDWFARREHKP